MIMTVFMSTLCHLYPVLANGGVQLHDPPVLLACQDPSPPSSSRRGGRRAADSPSQQSDIRPAGAEDVAVPPELRIIPLKHASVTHISGILNQALLHQFVFADQRTNSLIYMGPPGLSARVVEMVQQLDTPAGAPTSERDVVVHPVKNRRAEDIVRQLHMSFGNREIRFAADEGTASIVLSGSTVEIESAVQAIEQLDRATPIVKLEFSYFGAVQKNAGRGDLLPIPEDLQGVGEELARFGEIGFLGRLTANAMQESDFVIKGGFTPDAHIDLSGKVLASPADGAVKVKVTSNAIVRNVATNQSQTYALETTISVRRGEYVVVGSAPNGKGDGEATILVLHVRP
ncbi:MAG TPA: secretin N-terminal domain-containing protein [Phycisphaerae bacterium]|nr:secretin N-terminal domain-containing protein [Phycisphaerae bacterium]